MTPGRSLDWEGAVGMMISPENATYQAPLQSSKEECPGNARRATHSRPQCTQSLERLDDKIQIELMPISDTTAK